MTAVHENLTQLGSKVPQPSHPDEAVLETFPNQHRNCDCEVKIDCEEFTCVCPLTEQPDYAEISIEYMPDEVFIESKSLKLYLASYRNIGMFHEYVVKKICDDLVKVLKPRFIEVSGRFNSRGGLMFTPTVRWAPGADEEQA